MTGHASHPLRAARDAVGLSRPELAHRAGCSARFIEAVEQGERDASRAMWERFEKALLRAAVARIADVEQAVAACAHLDRADADATVGGNGRVPAR